jgi:putative transposase
MLMVAGSAAGDLAGGRFFDYPAAFSAVRKSCLTLVNNGLTMKLALPKLLTPLFLILAHASHKDLIRQIQFLKIENEMLRSRLPKIIRVTPAEKQRLLKFGRLLGSAIKELITIVTPRTFARWLAEGKKGLSRRRGRPRTLKEIRDMLLRMARENIWGYTRLLGELKKLGIRRIGRTTVQNILKAEGLDTNPERKRSTWDQFIKCHAHTLWACDFISKKVWTLRGPIDYFLLFFINVESRHVWVAPATAHPDAAWVAQQARNFGAYLQETGRELSYLLRDRDRKFTDQFDDIIISMATGEAFPDIDAKKRVCELPYRSPNFNAYASRCTSLAA